MSANNNKIPEDFLFDIDGRKSSFDFDDLVDPEDLKTKYRNNLYSGIVNVKKLFAKQFPELKHISKKVTTNLPRVEVSSTCTFARVHSAVINGQAASATSPAVSM